MYAIRSYYVQEPHQLLRTFGHARQSVEYRVSILARPRRHEQVHEDLDTIGTGALEHTDGIFVMGRHQRQVADLAQDGAGLHSSQCDAVRAARGLVGLQQLDLHDA